MSKIELKCFKCSNLLKFEEISRRSECDRCGEDVRCCMNCEFYDPKSYNECRETSADPVREKDRSNFCGFFRVKSPTGESAEESRDKLMSAAEALFKK